MACGKVEMKRECFTPSKQWACAELFSASFEQKFTVIRNT